MITELHPLLHPIDVNTYDPKRVELLWNKLQQCDYAFDDLTRGQPEYFLNLLLIPSNQFVEIGDMQGMVLVAGMQPKLNASLHFAMFDHSLKITDVMKAAKSLMDNLFNFHLLHRLTATVPQVNDAAKRLAVLLGFKYEGAIRQAFLSNGKHSDILIYGLLKSEFEANRRF